MKAAENGHIEVVKMLLDRNANIEAAKVSRNVSIACTALRIVLIIIILILIIILLLAIFNILLNYILI